MADIESQARGILARARAQAEGLLAAAQEEAETLKADAQAQGMAEGRAAGLKVGREEGLKVGKEQALAEHRQKLTQLVNALSAATKELDGSRRQLQAAATRDVIELAIAIAERVTKRKGEIDPQVLIANVTEALKLVVHSSDIRIALHPGQKAVMADALPALKLQWPALAHVELVEDSKLAPGGCRVFTAHGQVDGDLDEQLRRIAVELVPERSC